jgi:hypothetical protein
MNNKPKRPKDQNQLARAIVSLATGETVEILHENGKNPAAVMLGRLGGLKGGLARAKALTPRQRSKIATFAAKARWKKKKKSN